MTGIIQRSIGRRAVLAGLGAVALPSCVRAETQSPDPIFAAIECHRMASEEHNRKCSALADLKTPEGDAEEMRLIEASLAARDEMKETEPTTIAGAVALLRYISDAAEDDMTLGALFCPDTLADGLEKLGTSTDTLALTAPSSSRALTQRPDPIFAVIEEHKAARAARLVAMYATFGMGGGPEDEPEDSPAHVAADEAHDEAIYREDEATIAVLVTAPTTLAGIAALLDHVAMPAFESPDTETILVEAIGAGGSIGDAAWGFAAHIAASVRIIGGLAPSAACTPSVREGGVS